MNLFLSANSSEVESAENNLKELILKPVVPPGYKEGPHPVTSGLKKCNNIFIFILAYFQNLCFPWSSSSTSLLSSSTCSLPSAGVTSPPATHSAQNENQNQ